MTTCNFIQMHKSGKRSRRQLFLAVTLETYKTVDRNTITPQGKSGYAERDCFAPRARDETASNLSSPFELSPIITFSMDCGSMKT